MEDDLPLAFARLIDELLASPHYGERWGRYWLDLVRYADTAGESSDYPVPQAFLYRNYVIDAFNKDTPYDEFLREQIAGDLLPHASDAEKREHIIATGGSALARRFGTDPDGTMHLTIEDTLDTLGKTTMALSLSCARCHDHKFDPITTQDYYALYGIFSSTRYPYPGSENKKRPQDFVPLVPEAEVKRITAPFANQLAALDQELTGLHAEREAARLAEKGDSKGAPPKRTFLELLEAFRSARAKRDALHDQIPLIPMAYALAEGTPANARVHKRGEPADPGDEVPRRFLTVLGGQSLPAEKKESGRRELADWIASPENPLTARVIVNRIWQHHFGRGLVDTPSDFGRQGKQPSHPELLDWLARRFIEDGWSIKKMHRRIFLSAAWQQAVIENDNAARCDPENVWHWRANRRRLDAETTRDAMLFIGGQLDSTPGGAHPFPPTKTWNFTQHSPFTATYETRKRSIYLMQQRIRRHPFLATFDGADPNASTAFRFTSTTPLQALFLMNDAFSHSQAEALAQRVEKSAAHDVARIDFAHRIALGRPATTEETSQAVLYLAGFRAKLSEHEATDVQKSWSSYARVLMSSNEFVYLD